MSTETAQHCRAFSISGRISSTLDSAAPLYICLAMSLLDIYFYRILSTQRTITNHIHTFMLNSLFCGLTFVYNGHTHASMVIFRFSILVYYLAIRSNYSSFKYGRAPFFLPWFLVTPAFTTLPPPSIPVLLNQGTSCELICSIYCKHTGCILQLFKHTHIPVSLCLKLFFLDHSHAFFLSTKHLMNFTPLNMLFLQSPAPAAKDHQWSVKLYKYHSKV